MDKIVLVNDLSPGDILMMSIAIRSLHKAYPGRFITDIRSPCNEIFDNNPYITKIPAKNEQLERNAIEKLKKLKEYALPEQLDDVSYIISHYPEIHRSGMTGLAFADGHRMFLEKQLGVDIPSTGLRPDLFFSNEELTKPRLVEQPYWLINAGIKNDYTLKFYPYYQEVVDLMRGKIQFVQIGHTAHHHPPLTGVIDMRGKTNLRELFLLSKHAEGAACPVSLQMVIMEALSKPCVVVAGAREGVRWQINPDHRFLYTNGAMKCAKNDGCWKSKIAECVFKTSAGNAMCMELIRPEDIVRAIELYYLGGALKMGDRNPKIINLTSNLDEKTQVVPVGYSMETSTTTNDKITFSQFKIDSIEGIEGIDFFNSLKSPELTASIFNVLRILKKINPQDTYLEAYQWHLNKRKESFMDTYHFMWYLGSSIKPKRILEIGTRTGTSICQLLSAYLDFSGIEKIVLCDLFNDGISTPQVVLDNINYLNIDVEDKIEFIVGNSLVEIPKYKKICPEQKFSHALIDGGHEKDTARKDLENVVDLIERGGFLTFDDIGIDGCNLDDVWQEFKQKYADKFVFMENYDGKGIGVAKRL